jgi:chromosome segregation ATPase
MSEPSNAIIVQCRLALIEPSELEMAAALLTKLKEECEAQHARAEKAERERDEAIARRAEDVCNDPDHTFANRECLLDERADLRAELAELRAKLAEAEACIAQQRRARAEDLVLMQKMADGLEQMTRERDEARATKDMWKERYQQAAEQADEVRAMLARTEGERAELRAKLAALEAHARVLAEHHAVTLGNYATPVLRRSRELGLLPEEP